MEGKTEVRLSHRNLVDAANALGYKEFNEGMCRGFSMMYSQAVLLGKEEVERFNRRISIIAEYKDNFRKLDQEIKKIQNTIASAPIHRTQLMEKYRDLLEIPAFFEGVELYLHPDRHVELFQESVEEERGPDKANQEDIGRISPLTQPIEKPLYMSKVLNSAHLFSSHSLDIYLQELEKIFKANPDTPAVVVINAADHSTCMSYQQEKGFMGVDNSKWLFLDTNNLYLKVEGEVSRLLTSEEKSKKTVSEISYSLNMPKKGFDALDITIVTNGDENTEILRGQLAALERAFDQSDDKSNKTDAEIYRLLYLACQSNEIDKVARIISRNENLFREQDQEHDVLKIAAQHGATAIVAFLIGNNFNPNLRDSKNNTAALDAACIAGNPAVVDLLIQAGALIDAKDSKDMTPIFRAVIENNTDVVKLLIEKHANFRAKDLMGMTPLFSAVANNNREIAALLIHDVSDVNIADLQGTTPLSIALTNENNTEMARLLIENGANVETKINGFSPLYSVVAKNNVKMAELLIEKGADLEIAADGMTPLYRAVLADAKEMVMLLIKSGAAVNTAAGIMTPLQTAALNNNVEMVSLLLQEGKADIKIQNTRGLTALDAAMGNGAEDTCCTLLCYAALNKIEDISDIANVHYYSNKDKNVLDFAFKAGNDGKTALDLAIESKNDKFATKLMEHALPWKNQIKIDLTEEKLNALFTLAVEQGNSQLCGYVLSYAQKQEKEVSIFAPIEDKKTAFALALENKNASMCEVLIQHTNYRKGVIDNDMVCQAVFDLAIKERKGGLCKELLNYANTNKIAVDITEEDCKELLTLAVEAKDHWLCEELLKYADANDMIIDMKVIIKEDKTLFDFLIEGRQELLCEILLDYINTNNLDAGITEENCKALLSLADEEGNDDLCQAIEEYTKVNFAMKPVVIGAPMQKSLDALADSKITFEIDLKHGLGN